MAGGPTGAALVIAAARAGALPFLAGGNKTPTAMQAEIEAVRGATDAAFGVNVLVPGRPTAEAAALAAYLGSLEAEVALRTGADSLCLQGSEAGGHRGAFANRDGVDQDYALLELLSRVRRQTDVPLIAAGGIAGPDEVATVLGAGAVAAQAGTAFLRCAESGANPAYRRALADPRFTSTAITRAFSGRRARGLVNQFMREHEGVPKAYPEINNATRPLRAAAAASGDPDRMSLYAGVNFRRAEARPAGEIVAQLAAGVGGGPEP